MHFNDPEIELLISAHLIPWELTAHALRLSGLCDGSGSVHRGEVVISDLDNIRVVGSGGSFLDWARSKDRGGRMVADLPLTDEVTRCHLYRLYDSDETIRGIAIPLNARGSRRVAASSGELSRVALAEDATHEAVRCATRGNRLACYILRLPEVFKVQNALGSSVAELLLREIALRLKHLHDNTIPVYELGTEALAVIREVEDTGDGGIAALEKRLVRLAQQIFGYPYEVDSLSLKIKGGIGYAVLPDDASDVNELLRGAEIASLEACYKPGGPAVLRCPASAMEENRENIILASQFYEGLLADQILPHIQPIAETETGRWAGGEILLRWSHPTMGPVAPPRFIKLAEEYGYISELTVMTIRKIAAWIQENRLEGLRLSFNISPVDFQFKELKRLANEVVNAGLTRSAKVLFEIVESTAVDDPEEANRIIETVKSDGIEFALDDFGTGYSSINLLRDLAVDYIKIDRSFIDGIASEARRQQLLEAICQACKAFDRRLVAEGVETEQDLAVIRALGIEFTQGYLFSRPLSLEEFASGLSENRAGQTRAAPPVLAPLPRRGTG